MRFLHLSDLHFGRSLCEYSLLEDQRHWCRQLLAHLDGIQYDAVLIAGDLYDRAVPSAGAVELCDWFLAELAIHDPEAVLDVIDTLDWATAKRLGQKVRDSRRIGQNVKDRISEVCRSRRPMPVR